MKIIKCCLLLFCLTYLVGCSQANPANSFINSGSTFLNGTNSKLMEVPEPKVIGELHQKLEQYSPQVKILSPRNAQVLDRTKISVELNAENFSVFRDEKLGLGNHLNLILDNEPSVAIYDLGEPFILENLAPGTHTIRVFATSPWGESFKNDGAYAQTTFSILTETNDNNPDRSLPLLTYGNPTGTYSAEPFLLDFYLTNAPLHSVAQSDPELLDWKIKTTVNGDSFFLENWQPVYLSGLNQGKNWIQLELVDEKGNNIENAFNNTVRVINYDPQEIDTLGKLFTDEISLTQAQSIVEQTYYIQPVGEPEIIEPSIEVEENPIEEPMAIEKEAPVIDSIVEDTIEETTISNQEEKDVQPTAELNTQEITPKTETEPVITPESEIDKIEDRLEKTEAVETVEDYSEDLSKTSTVTESIPDQQNIIITEEDLLTSEPIAEIAIPQPEAVEITSDEIAITIPDSETNTMPEVTTETPIWWKRLLVGLRQKLESLVELLPSKA